MATEDLREKLEKVERTISIFKRKHEELVEEITIDLPVEELRNIITPKEGDTMLYLPYVLDSEQLKSINNLLGGKINIDLEVYYYVLECNGIYNW
jgi:hypothetical protein